jgi:lysophospholipase L1-like esterase
MVYRSAGFQPGRRKKAMKHLIKILAVMTFGCAAWPCWSALAGPAVGVVADPCAEVFVASSGGAPAAANTQPQWVPDWAALDWSQQCRYGADNAALAKPGRGRAVFIGDSITEGWMVADPTFFGPERIDRGISGQTTAQMLVRFRADVLDLKPAVVHIMAGTNDIAGNTGPTSLARIQANIISMVELAQAHRITVILASIPPANRIAWRPQVEPAAVIRAMNRWLQDYAARRHLVYVDYYAALADEESGMKAVFTEDGVHPNAAGFQAMRPLALAALRKAGW